MNNPQPTIVTRLFGLLLLSMLFLAACLPLSPATPSPTPVTPTMTPTFTTTPTTTQTERPTLTVTPTPTLTATFTPTPAPNIPPTLETAISPTPGVIVRGHVRLADGSGLPGIPICRNFASYPGVVVATTDADGYFQSDFAFIPGDEMVSVWPNATGYTFQPDNIRWRHYYGPEDRTLDFVASPASATAVPLFPCQ